MAVSITLKLILNQYGKIRKGKGTGGLDRRGRNQVLRKAQQCCWYESKKQYAAIESACYGHTQGNHRAQECKITAHTVLGERPCQFWYGLSVFIRINLNFTTL